MTDQITAVLLHARGILSAGHWCKGRGTDGRGNVCAFGAIGRAIHEFDIPMPITFAVDIADRMRKHTPDHIGLANYNDAETTTLADVLEVFDKAIAELGAVHLIPATASAAD